MHHSRHPRPVIDIPAAPSFTPVGWALAIRLPVLNFHAGTRFDLRRKIRTILDRFEDEATPFNNSEVLRGLNPSDVDICDLAALHRATDREYALLVRHTDDSEERVLIRGIPNETSIPPCFLDQGLIWYAHSHPDDWTRASGDDRQALQEFAAATGQQKSVIVAASGRCESFTEHHDLSSWLPP